MPVGFVGSPGKRNLRMTRVSLVRLIGASPPPGPGGVQRSQGVGLRSNILMRSATAAHDRFIRLSFARALLPVDRDPSGTGGGPAVGSGGTPPIYLGSAFGMLDHHRLKMVRFVMNPKFGPKTRPC